MADFVMPVPVRARLPWSLGPAILVPAGVLAALVALVLVGPFLLSDPDMQVLADARLGPGSEGYLLGTDGLGRDVLARALDGGRISLFVGAMAVVIGASVGGTFGILAGYAGGRVDAVISRVTEILLAFPALIMALAIATFMGPSIRNIILAISVNTVPAYIRLARANAIKVRGGDFITAAALSGARTRYILVRHIVPLVAQSVVAYGLLAMGTAIITESALSFLGLGVRPPQATWGGMLADGKAELTMAAHVAFVPAALLFLTVLSLNLLGEAMRMRVDRKVGAA